MQITINGEPRTIQEKSTISDLLVQLEYNSKHVAVALNKNCILKKNYQQTVLSANDDVEILAPMAGG